MSFFSHKKAPAVTKIVTAITKILIAITKRRLQSGYDGARTLLQGACSQVQIPRICKKNTYCYTIAPLPACT